VSDAKQSEREANPQAKAAPAPLPHDPYLAEGTRRMLWSLLPAAITGPVMLYLLISTHRYTHHISNRAQDVNVVTDVVVLFFCSVMFIGSLCFAWNVYRDQD
jgi:hypothetical protein